MKRITSKSLLGLCVAGVLAFSMPAYASQITITPLETGTGASSGAAQETQSSSRVAQPVISSEGAALLDASTGRLLYGKNAETAYYPASITKLMTALLVAERCSLDETVTFSATATTNLESGAVSIGMTEGDTLTVRQCLYALLLKSANEVGNALAEHVAGSNAAFAELMNAKAAGLGCTNTHFTNPHGLNDTEHYTSPHDMALIARAAFENATVRTVAGTLNYTLPATKKNPSGVAMTMGHKMLNPNDSRYYSGIVGGKTGYTSRAGNTLVTEAQRDGVTLVAVVMKSQSTHYTDTKALLDYGFALAQAGEQSTTAAGPSGSGSTAGPGGSAAETNAAGPGGSAAETNAAAPQGSGAGTADTTQSPGVQITPVQTESSQTTASSQEASGGPGAAVQTGWVQENGSWYYIKANGLRAMGELITADGNTYWLDADGVMAKGWRQIEGLWRYFRSDGSMARNYWTKTDENGKTYYLDETGVMLVNATTPDGYQVGADGAWIR